MVFPMRSLQSRAQVGSLVHSPTHHRPVTWYCGNYTSRRLISNDFCLSLMYHLLPTLCRTLSSLICTYLVLLPRANWSTIYHLGIMSQIPSVFICVKTDWSSRAKSPRPYNQSYLLAHILISWNGVFNIAERGPCRSTFPCHDSLVLNVTSKCEFINFFVNNSQNFSWNLALWPMIMRCCCDVNFFCVY